MILENICEAVREKWRGKQIKKFLLLFTLIVALCSAYGYAQEKALKSIDDEDGFIRSNEGSGDMDHIRVGAGESDERTFISIISFDTSSLSGVTITSAKIILTVENNKIWDNNNPDPEAYGPSVDLSTAFSGDPAFQIPDDRDASADVTDCAGTPPWGMQGKLPGQRVYIPLTQAAIDAINTSGRTQFRINTGDATGVTNPDNAMDFYDGGNRSDSPILWINPSTPEFIPWPELLSAEANDPDQSYGGIDIGDTLTLKFDVNTNTPPADTKAQIDGLVDFGGKSLGTNYTGAWADPCTLVITVTNATDANLAIDDTVSIIVDGTNDLKNAAGTSAAVESSANVSGHWGPLPPELLYAVAKDPDHGNPALDNGDTLTLIFNMKTNAPAAATKAQIDGLIDWNGKSLGTNYTGSWNADANQLLITVGDATGGNLAIGDTISIIADGTNDLKNQPQTSLGSTSSNQVSGFWGPSPRPLFIGLNNVGGNPALKYVTFDPTQDAGHCFDTSGATAAQAAKVSHIEVDSRGGQGGGIYIAIDDGLPTGERLAGTKYLKEYRYGGGAFTQLRQRWEDLTDIAVSPYDYGLYGFEKNMGGIVRYDPNGTSFDESGISGTDDVNCPAQIAIGFDGWIQCNFYHSPDDGALRGFTYNEQTHEFDNKDGKDQPYLIDEMLISPFDGSIFFDNELEQGGTLEQNGYPFCDHNGYETVSQTPYDNEEDLMPGISDFVILNDGTVVAVDPNGSYIDGKCSLTAWEPHPHDITGADWGGNNEGRMVRIAEVNIVDAVADPNIKYRMAADQDGFIYVFGEGVLYAYQLDKVAGTLNLIDFLAIGAGTEIAAGPLHKISVLPASGITYDLGRDYSHDNMQNGWEYMDPCEVLLANDTYLDPSFMCGDEDNPLGCDAWAYPLTGPTGPWDFGDYYGLPWLNNAECMGGDQGAGDVQTFGPLLIKWTAPEAFDNVEITGALWQVNNSDTNTVDRQIAYTLKHNDDELASGAVLVDESGNTLEGTGENRANRVWFAGDEDSKIVIPHIDAGDTITLLIDGSGPEGNGECSWGYARLHIFIPKCWFGLLGDINGDCKVDFADVKIMADNWLAAGEPEYTHDTTVNFKDYTKLAAKWLIDCGEDNAACEPDIKSISSEDGFLRADSVHEDGEPNNIRVGDDGFGHYYKSIVSFDTSSLKGVPITKAWIGLTVKNKNIWGSNPNPNPDKLGLTLDLRVVGFNNDAALERFADLAAAADVPSCAVAGSTSWGLHNAAVDQQVLIELNAAAIAAINTSGRTQFRINTTSSDDVPTYGRNKADAMDFYDGSADSLDKAPVLIVE